MDPIFLAELAIVAVIVVMQFLVFFRNNQAIRRLQHFFPKPSYLKTRPTQVPSPSGEAPVVAESIDLIADHPKFSPPFREVVETTNTYLGKNQGAADFDMLTDMAESRAVSHEMAIESNITLPLYIGLLCTFSGVIIGLVKIAIVGVTDAAIQSFIGGVLIGMIGSATGLALTVRSNFIFKEGKKARDRGQYDYFTFLRSQILPALKKDPEQPLSTLRDNLAAFNDNFARYQQHMNESLGETLRLFRELKGVFNQIRSVEKGLSGMNHLLEANDGLIDKQVAYMESYAQKAETFSRKLGTHFEQADKQVETLVAENIKALEKSTQAAYIKMDQYLATLQGSDRKAFAEALQKDLADIRGDIDTLQAKSLEVNAQLLSQLNTDDLSRQEMTQQIKAMNARLEEALSGKGSYMNSLEFRVFTYVGTGAFVIGVFSALVYLFNTLSA